MSSHLIFRKCSYTSLTLTENEEGYFLDTHASSTIISLAGSSEQPIVNKIKTFTYLDPVVVWSTGSTGMVMRKMKKIIMMNLVPLHNVDDFLDVDTNDKLTITLIATNGLKDYHMLDGSHMLFTFTVNKDNL